MFYLTTHSTILFMVIWQKTCGKEPLRQRERKLLPIHELLFLIVEGGRGGRGGTIYINISI